MDQNHCFTGILGPISLLDPRIQQDPINLLAKPLADGQPKDIVVLFGSAKPSGGMALCDYFLSFFRFSGAIYRVVSGA